MFKCREGLKLNLAFPESILVLSIKSDRAGCPAFISLHALMDVPSLQLLTVIFSSLQVHFLYQFSLQFFLDIFQCVLYENPKLKNLKDPQQRLKVLSSDLFQVNKTRITTYHGFLVDIV